MVEIDEIRFSRKEALYLLWLLNYSYLNLDKYCDGTSPEGLDVFMKLIENRFKVKRG